MQIDEYQRRAISSIDKCLDDKGCQPIIFVGSGLSRRYFSAPNWIGLLGHLIAECPLFDRGIAFYQQSLPTLPKIGSHIADRYQEWAWGTGRNSFPAELFAADQPKSIYVKYHIANYLKALTPKDLDLSDQSLKEELEKFAKIKPHSIITTNYDQFLETIFPDFEPIIGQQIIRQHKITVGEINKIHGCVSSPVDLVFTDEDYQDFLTKKKYLSAKLLTYFVEHPMIFIGYSAADDNIRAILSDIDEILGTSGDLIENIFFVEWAAGQPSDPPHDRLIAVASDRSVRVRNITTHEFGWVYEALAQRRPLQSVSPKTLRALLARTYQLVRHDIPSQKVEVDFTDLARAAEVDGELAKMFGITSVDGPTDVNARYPYCLSQIAQKLGYKYWNKANDLIKTIEQQKGVNIKSSDNRYHMGIKSGRSGVSHIYSSEALTLLEKVRDGKVYELQL